MLLVCTLKQKKWAHLDFHPAAVAAEVEDVDSRRAVAVVEAEEGADSRLAAAGVAAAAHVDVVETAVDVEDAVGVVAEAAAEEWEEAKRWWLSHTDTRESSFRAAKRTHC